MSKWKESRIIKLLAETVFIVSVAVLSVAGILLMVAYSNGALSDDYNANEYKANIVYDEFKQEIRTVCDNFFYSDAPLCYDYNETDSENLRLLENYLHNKLSEDVWNADFYRFSVNVTFNPENNLSKRYVIGTYSDEYSCDICDTYEYFAYPQHHVSVRKEFDTYDEMDEYIEELYDTGYAIYSLNESGYDSVSGYTLEYEYYESTTIYISVDSYMDTTASDPILDNYLNARSDIGNNIKIIHYIHANRYSIYILVIAAILALVVSFILSMCSAGHKKGNEGIYSNWYDKAPWEVNIILFSASVILAVFAGNFMVECSSSYYYVDGVYDYLQIISLQKLMVTAVSFTCSVELLHILFRSIVVKIKARKGKDNIMLIRFAKKHFGKESKFKRFIHHMWEDLPFMARAIIFYIILTIVELVALCFISYFVVSYDSGSIALFLLLIKIILAVIYFIFVVQLRMLYDGGKDLARGNFDHTIDTTYMFWCFKKHGEHLNSIKTGLADAVTERMKSERMKTELITNVSHDIKTPLTSIINYVDLLEKEGITDQPEASYIEVLKRQSFRLKKLIDDLVEASKASSGAMSVSLEPMDVNMMVNQASAEYMDKLMQNNITLMVTNSRESSFIMADGRHLWRVIDNLLNNAYKYAMPGTRLYVDINADTDNVRVIFRNISKEQLNISSDELMERFVRGDQSRNTEGSGLGLSISLSLCQLMGAEFVIDIDGDLFKAIITFSRIKNPVVSDEEVNDKK